MNSLTCIIVYIIFYIIVYIIFYLVKPFDFDLIDYSNHLYPRERMGGCFSGLIFKFK